MERPSTPDVGKIPTKFLTPRDIDDKVASSAYSYFRGFFSQKSNGNRDKRSFGKGVSYTKTGESFGMPKALKDLVGAIDQDYCPIPDSAKKIEFSVQLCMRCAPTSVDHAQPGTLSRYVVNLSKPVTLHMDYSVHVLRVQFPKDTFMFLGNVANIKSNPRVCSPMGKLYAIPTLETCVRKKANDKMMLKPGSYERITVVVDVYDTADMDQAFQDSMNHIYDARDAALTSTTTKSNLRKIEKTLKAGGDGIASYIEKKTGKTASEFLAGVGNAPSGKGTDDKVPRGVDSSNSDKRDATNNELGAPSSQMQVVLVGEEVPPTSGVDATSGDSIAPTKGHAPKGEIVATGNEEVSSDGVRSDSVAPSKGHTPSDDIVSTGNEEASSEGVTSSEFDDQNGECIASGGEIDAENSERVVFGGDAPAEKDTHQED